MSVVLCPGYRTPVALTDPERTATPLDRREGVILSFYSQNKARTVGVSAQGRREPKPVRDAWHNMNKEHK